MDILGLIVIGTDVTHNTGRSLYRWLLYRCWFGEGCLGMVQFRRWCLLNPFTAGGVFIGRDPLELTIDVLGDHVVGSAGWFLLYGLTGRSIDCWKIQ